MNEAAVKQKLDELFQMAGCTASEAHGVYVGTQAGDISVEEALDQLRMHLRYLIFDVEATRRENSYLRRMLDLRNRHRREDDSGPAGG
jgi:hypothetical protein